MAYIKISKYFIQEIPELMSYLASQFGDLIEVTTIDDVVHNRESYIVHREGISPDSGELELTFTTKDIPPYVPAKNILDDFRGQKVWFDDNSFKKPEWNQFEGRTDEQLRQALDFQMDEYNRHADKFCKEITLSFIADIQKELDMRALLKSVR